MKDWLHAGTKDIDNMTIEEAFELVQGQIDLGHTDGDFKPRAHFTKALEIVLSEAKKNKA